MANMVPNGSMPYIASTNNKQKPYQKAYLLMKEIGPVEKRRDRKSNGSRQRNKTGDSELESNDMLFSVYSDAVLSTIVNAQ